MKSFLIFLAFLLPLGISYSQFTDDFTDGNFTASPAWGGNTIDFQVTAGELQLNAPSVSSYKYLSTNSQAINTATWEFKVRLTFNPSSSNYAKVYLVSNTSNLAGSLNGYYIKIGGTDDEVSLYSQSGTSDTEIIDGRNGVVNVSSVNLRVRVTRSSGGAWQVFSDTSATTSTFISEGTATDNTHTQSLFFGVGCNFTSTRSDKFFFDDFTVTGTAAVDNTKPVLDSVKVISNTQLELVYSEPVALITSQTTTNYSANNGLGNPSTAVRNASDLSRVTLTFTTPFAPGTTNTLTTTNVTDIAGNIINTSNNNFLFFIPAVANYRDVVINEIFADPSPMLGLPDGEFIELYNATTSKIFDLKDWQLTDGSSTSTLPSFTLLSNSYVILHASSTTGDFSLYTEKLALSSFPSLNNTGETIELKDNTGAQIDLVEYSISMYQDEVKDNGGWSLEQLNPFSPCFNPNNWIASNNANGGTPTQLNSVNDTTPDTENPFVVSSFATSNTTIEISFNEPIDTALFFANTILSEGRTITSYSSLNPFNTQLLLTVSPALDTGKVYLIILNSLVDCKGNSSGGSSEVILANENQLGAILINEVLFNPYTGDEDFVELYNNSNLYLNLKDWGLGNDDNGAAGNLKTIPTNYIIKPNDYVVITKDAAGIKSRYRTHSPSKFIQLETLPTYSNESGTVYVLTPTGQESDQFTYHEDYHFQLLREVEGISLERISPNQSTQLASNWHSAAEDVGFATPGVQNSQYTPAKLFNETVAVSPELFSPDNDGFEDILTISYTMEKAGFVGNVIIYDAQGRVIKSLISNQLLAKQGSFNWDGTTDQVTKARIGRYVILFEFYDLEGNVKTVKKTCVVAHRL